MKKMLIIGIGLIFFLCLSQSVQALEPKIITQTHTLENIDFWSKYAISSDFNTWRITDNKAFNITLGIETNPNNATILVEHMHCDVFIESKYSVFDGITQDSMDDSYHGLQGGFYVALNYTYNEVFSIEGSSPEFTTSMENAWLYGDLRGSWWEGGEETFKFSENRLTDNYGVIGESIYVVFDVVVKYPQEEYFHTLCITDNIFIAKNGTIMSNENNQADIPSNDRIDGFNPLMTGIISLSIIPLIIYMIKRKKMQ